MKAYEILNYEMIEEGCAEFIYTCFDVCAESSKTSIH